MGVIKYKAWQKNFKKMLKVVALKFDDKGLLSVKVNNGANAAPPFSTYGRLYKDFPLSDLELIRFAGLEDMNEKEVFEGDIVEVCYDTYGGQGILRGVVEYNQGAFWVSDLMAEDSMLFVAIGSEEVEVLGNIYENPGLLLKK